MNLNILLVVGAALTAPFLRTEPVDPDVVLKEINAYRANAIKQAQESGKAFNATEVIATAKQMAVKACEGVEPSKVEPAKAFSWAQLFIQAGKYGDIETLCDQYMKSGPTKEMSFRAHMMCLTAYSNLKEYDKAAMLVGHLEPTDDSSRISLATQIAGWIAPEIAKTKGVDAGLKLIAQAEATLPKSVADERMTASLNAARGRMYSAKATIYTNAGDTAKAHAVLKAGSEDANLPEATRRSMTMELTRATIMGSVAPEIEIGKTYGEFKGLESLRGKVVLIDFFAHWCGPCIAAFPDMRRMYDDLKDKGLEIIGVTRYYGYYGAERNMAPDVEFGKMAEFMSKHKMNWPVVYSNQNAFTAYGVSGIPTVVVIGRDGKVYDLKVGYSEASFAEFRTKLEKLLNE